MGQPNHPSLFGVCGALSFTSKRCADLNPKPRCAGPHLKTSCRTLPTNRRAGLDLASAAGCVVLA